MLRLHLSRYDAKGELSLFSLAGSARVAQYSRSAEDFWSPLIQGDSVALEYRPANSAGTELPFHIDLLMHGVTGLFAQRKGCEAGDLTCEDAAWSDAARAVAVLQYEDSGYSYSCTGWLINTRAGSRAPYLVTSSACISDQRSAATMVALFRSREQRVGATLLAAGSTASLLKLESAPPDAYFLGWAARQQRRIVPLETRQAIAVDVPEGELRFEPGVGGAAAAGVPVLADAGIVAGMMTSSGAGQWFPAIYSDLSAYLEDAAACGFRWSVTGSQFPNGGGDGAVDVGAEPGCQWSAVSHSGWIRITSGTTYSATGHVAFQVTPNASRAARSGSISVAGKIVSVTQEGTAAAACGATAVRIGEPLEGELSPDCLSLMLPGRFAKRFIFNGTKDQHVVIGAESIGFDPYVYLLDSEDRILQQDDDGGTGSAARIPAVTGSYRLPYSGAFSIEVTSANDAGVGGFRLAACPGQTPTPIGFNQNVQGQLTSSSCVNNIYYTQLYSFLGTAGQQVAITMASTTLDSFLVLNGPDGTALMEDDDSGGNLNSRIPPAGFFTLPRTGAYVIEASHWDPPFRTGGFALGLLLNAAPPVGATPLKFVPVTPCRVMDTRSGQGTTGAFGPPSMSGAATRDVPVPSSPCSISAQARAYSLNVTVVPSQPLSFLTVWPARQARPNVSTLNSFDGRVVANAAIVPAGAAGSISVYATDNTQVIIDINGYFIP